MHFMLILAAEFAGKYLSIQANSLKTRRALQFNYLGKQLCRLAGARIRGTEIKAAARQMLERVRVFTGQISVG